MGKPPARRSGPLILAIGDSFTFGDEVEDDQTWPAQLENATSYRVSNAGVSAYGLDQIVMRAETLVPKYHPDVIVVSLIYDDLRRCRMSVNNGAAKPYFEITNGSVRRNNVPVPQPEGHDLDPFRRLFGYSYVVHVTMDRLDPGYWWKGTPRNSAFVAGDDTLAISQALFSRLGATAHANQSKVLIVAQPESDVTETCCPLLPELLAFIHTERARPSIARVERDGIQDHRSLTSPRAEEMGTRAGRGSLALYPTMDRPRRCGRPWLRATARRAL